jgi:hypothetical protein
MARTGRPKTIIEESQLRGVLKLYMDLEGAAAFFKCSPDTIERWTKKNFKKTFADFRRECMVETRLALRQEAITLAMGRPESKDGKKKEVPPDKEMVKFCLKYMDDFNDIVQTAKLLEDERKKQTEILSGQDTVTRIFETEWSEPQATIEENDN